MGKKWRPSNGYMGQHWNRNCLHLALCIVKHCDCLFILFCYYFCLILKCTLANFKGGLLIAKEFSNSFCLMKSSKAELHSSQRRSTTSIVLSQLLMQGISKQLWVILISFQLNCNNVLYTWWLSCLDIHLHTTHDLFHFFIRPWSEHAQLSAPLRLYDSQSWQLQEDGDVQNRLSLLRWGQNQYNSPAA